MAHCNVSMSGDNSLASPTSTPILMAHDALPLGSNNGLGCASNGSVVACSYWGTTGDNVVAYSNYGTRLWGSGHSLDRDAWASVPMVASDGGVIAASRTKIARFSNAGALLWVTPNPNGTPTSPVLTASGALVVATINGPISAFDSTTGRLLGSLLVRQSPSSTNFFQTTNTPCVNGNRVYVAMQQEQDPLHTGWLVAIDVDPTNPTSPLTIAWEFTFTGPTGASPVLIGNVIYFDGHVITPGQPSQAYLYAVRDDGTSGTLLWSTRLPTAVATSPVVDPRGGMWIYTSGLPWLYHLDPRTGVTVEIINVSKLVGDVNSNIPSSALSITGLPSAPVLVLGTGDLKRLSSYVVAINLVTHTLAWEFNLRPSLIPDYAAGQFPTIVTPLGKPAVAFSTRNEGAYFLAQP